MDKTTIKVSKEFNIHITVIAKLENRMKENLTDEILRRGLEPYKEKYPQYIWE